MVKFLALHPMESISLNSFVLLEHLAMLPTSIKTRNRYNQVPHLTQDTNRKVTTAQSDIINESQKVSPFPAGDHKALISRRARKNNKNKTENIMLIWSMLLNSVKGMFFTEVKDFGFWCYEQPIKIEIIWYSYTANLNLWLRNLSNRFQNQGKYIR